MSRHEILHQNDAVADDPCEAVDGKLKPILGLRGRLLVLTAIFVLIAELLIFPPSAANFRNVWLSDRLKAAEIAALALEASPDGELSGELAERLRQTTELRAVAVMQDGMRELIFAPPDQEQIGELVVIDLSSQSRWRSMWGVFGHMTAPKGRYLRVVDTPSMTSDSYVEILLPEKQLKADLLRYSQNIFLISLLISAVTGGLVYFAVYRLVVRPMMGLTRAVVSFRDSPEGASPIRPSGRMDEIGRAELALQDMQETVSSAFRQRSRLAELGEAVAKINHDLRNSLSVAQLVSDSIQRSDDPRVRQAAPRLERALSRAVGLAEATLQFGREKPHTPKMTVIALHDCVEDALREGLSTTPDIDWLNDVEEDIRVLADPDDLHRILSNLARNAGQAISQSEATDADGLISIVSRTENGSIVVDVKDNGPGVPERIKARLFEPFSASASRDGSGLGLAISRELARGMGGEVDLHDNSAQGAVFRVTLKSPPE